MKYLLLLALLLVPMSCGDREQPEDNNHQQQHQQQQSAKAVTPQATIKEKQDEVARLRGQIALLEAQIKEKQQQETATKALWVGRVAGILAIVALVASFFLSSYPILPVILRQVSLIAGGVSVLAFVAVHLISYLIIIGSVVGIVLLGVALVGWWRDRHALKAVISGVEAVKPLIGDYKDRLRKHVKGLDDAWVDAVRKVKKKPQ